MIEALQGVRIFAVVACGVHSLALSKAGEVYSFGYSGYGALGHGADTADQYTPRLIAALKGMRVSAVDGGVYHSLVLGGAGEVYSFGRGESGRLGHGNKANQNTPQPIVALHGVRVRAMAAGGEHSLVVSTAG